MNTIFSLTPSMLGSLDPRQAVEVFRDLLWCQARRENVPLSKIHISSEITVADGGIDASIDDNVLVGPGDLVEGSTGYQIKTGTNARPWQKSWVQEELFGRGAVVDRSNLGAGVRRCLDSNGRYVLACFGCDPTSEKIVEAQENIKSCFHSCEYPNARVNVWGQTTLIGYFSLYPSLCLKIAQRDSLEFQSHASWGMSSEMSLPLHFGEDQERLVEEIRSYLRGNQVRHIRVIGEPGLGKTRLVLQATLAEDLAPLVVYVRHAEDFQRTPLFNTMLRTDNEFFVVLVIDECACRERASIWDVLRERSNRCRLITIDHGPENAHDEWMQVVECPLLPDKQIASIIREYVPLESECRRWAEFCGGSPRVAHVIGQNLQRNPDDILKPPATVQVWERFVAGYDAIDSQAVRERWIVLQHVALFLRFGFEAPVQDEARFIADLAREVDPNLTWPRFQTIVNELKQRRILQGKTTLFIAPHALHVYLWLEFWTSYGRTQLGELLPRIPRGLTRWFTAMFRYAHGSDVALKQVEEILGSTGPFSDCCFATSPEGCVFLCELAEAAPKATLHCIERTIGQLDRDGLLAFRDGRQHVVWALEKIAVWPELFRGAARVLLKLGANDDSKYPNNASKTFAGLFSLACGPMAPTEASPQQRIPVLRAALESTSPGERQLARRACESALSIHQGVKFIGPEHQGLRPVAKLWCPQVWGEVFDAYKEVWNLLVEVSSTWHEPEHTKAGNVLIGAAPGLLQIPSLANLVLDTLNSLVDHRSTDLHKMVEIITRCLRVWRDGLPPKVVSTLHELDARIAGATFASRLRRFVMLSTWDEEYDQEHKRCDDLRQKIAELAREAVNSPEQIAAILGDLVTGANHNLDEFGYQLAGYDMERNLLVPIMEAHREARDTATTVFFGGYLRALFDDDVGKWESVVSDLLSDEAFLCIIGELVRRSGFSNTILVKLIAAYDAGRLASDQFRPLVYTRELRGIAEEHLAVLIKRLTLPGNLPDVSTALELMDRYYCDTDPEHKLPEELTLALLLNEALFAIRHNSMPLHHWSVIAEQYITQYPASGTEILKWALKHCHDWGSGFLESSARPWHIIKGIVEEKPEECWRIVTSMLDDLDSDLAYGIQWWLRPPTTFSEGSLAGQIALFPVPVVINWIEIEPETRAPYIARTAPKTFDPKESGTLTRELLVRFGNLERVRNALFTSFRHSGWVGSSSAHYRKLRDKARSWLKNEDSSNVIKWVEQYIEQLNQDIMRAEIDEEREY